MFIVLRNKKGTPWGFPLRSERSDGESYVAEVDAVLTDGSLASWD
jgi:hypothetical protein